MICYTDASNSNTWNRPQRLALDLALLLIGVLVVVTAFVLGLLWLTQKLLGNLHASIYSKTTNARITDVLICLGLTYLWLSSFEQLLKAPKWSMAFNLNLAGVIALPILLVAALKRILPIPSNAAQETKPANSVAR